VGIRTKLFLTVLALAVPAIVLIGLLSYVGGKAAVEETTLERMTAVRAGKAHQIAKYIDEIRSLARVFARDRMIFDAMIDFDDAYQLLQDVEVTGEQREAVDAYYAEVFLPRLEVLTNAPVDPKAHIPTDDADIYLQYQYIVANQNPSSTTQVTAAGTRRRTACSIPSSGISSRSSDSTISS